MTIKNKKREVLLMRVAGESWQHRRHRTGKVLKKENNINKKLRLQQIINEEHYEQMVKQQDYDS